MKGSILKCLLSNSPNPIVIIDEDGQLIKASAEARNLFATNIIKNGTLNTMNDFLVHLKEKVKAAINQSHGKDFVLESIDAFEFEGSTRYYESRLFPIPGSRYGKHLFGYLAVDVTEKITTQLELKDYKEKFSNYLNNAPYGVFLINDNAQFIDVNPAASVITGYKREQLLQMSIQQIIAHESIEATMQQFERLREIGLLDIEMEFCHADGATRWGAILGARSSETTILCFAIDITEKKQVESELVYISTHDSLTGLFNRRYFESEIKRLETGQYLPLSIIMGDINGLKLVNDAFGHAEGDRLIKEAATIMKACCREGDVLARIGGDEFGILLPNTDSTAAYQILNKIQLALKMFNEDTRNDKFQHSVSLGFGTKFTTDEDIAQAAKVAEDYMYQRKLLEQNNSHSTIIASIKATMFEKSHETEKHAERLVRLSKIIAEGLQLSQKDKDKLELLATLHDIGKVAISDQILTKPGQLNAREWVEMKRHPEIGYRIAMASPDLFSIAEGILSHHEKWDGTGYPKALKGEEIPLLSRIIAIVDAYDAMTQDRSYRKAMAHEDAITDIERNAGTQFDPSIVRVFIKELSVKQETT